MESIHTFFKIFLPKYLKSLPVPKTFGGLAALSGDEWLSLAPLIVAVSMLLYASVKVVCKVRRRKVPKPKVNFHVQKEDPKVVTQMDLEDIGDNIALCRCWRSKKFPLCDGSHNQHNTEAKDNVGPLLLRRAGEEK